MEENSFSEDILYMTLPTFLKDDIIAFEEGIISKSTVLDCLFNEVQGSINSALYDNQITQEEAVYLRKKHLGL